MGFREQEKRLINLSYESKYQMKNVYKTSLDKSGFECIKLYFFGLDLENFNVLHNYPFNFNISIFSE